MPQIVRAPVAFEHRKVGIAQGKARHFSPLGSKEGRRFGEKLATLVDGKTEFHRLPAVGVHQPAGAGHFREDVGLELLVAGVGVIVGFVGAVCHPVRDELLGEVVAKRRRPVGGVIGGSE